MLYFLRLQPELAGKAFLTVKDEFDMVLEKAKTFSKEQFNKMVAQYARKALEFTVIQYLEGNLFTAQYFFSC